MRSYHHYYHSKLYRAIHSDFWRLEFSIWLEAFAWSLFGLFVPIFLLQNGWSLTGVLIYFLIYHGTDVPLNFVARKFVIAWGARAVTAIGIVCAIIFTASFHLLSHHAWWILATLAVIRALYDTFYWVGHMYLFIESSGRPDMAGRNTGTMNGIRIFAGMLAPAFGATILVLGGQNVLLGFSAVIFAFAIIPLFSLKHVRNKPQVTMPLKEFLREPRERRDYLSFGLYCIHAAAEDPIWTIFVFVVLGTLNSVALLAIVVSVSTIILSYVAGLATRKSATVLISIGGLIAATTWILRLTIPNPIFYYASVLVIGYCAILLSVPIESNIVERGRIKDALWAATIRNAVSMFTPFILFAALLPLVGIFKISFVTAAIGLLLLVAVIHWFRIPKIK